MTGINVHGIWAIYKFEMARTLRTLWQSIVTPVITTSLYFIVFGMGMGAHIATALALISLALTCFFQAGNPTQTHGSALPADRRCIERNSTAGSARPLKFMGATRRESRF